MSNDRQERIFSSILKYFVEDGIPVGSKLLEQDFDISGATIRNDMAQLEKEGLITQPHPSAGRIPTEIGYRFYVDHLIEFPKNEPQIKKEFMQIKEAYLKSKTIEKVYDTVAIISRMTENIAFATIPENKKTYYMGISNILRIPEFANNIATTSEVIEVLESGFFSILNELSIDNSIKIFIGRENMIEQIQSCSMLATKYNTNGFSGILGIIGPLRMKYAFNKTILELGAETLND